MMTTMWFSLCRAAPAPGLAPASRAAASAGTWAGGGVPPASVNGVAALFVEVHAKASVPIETNPKSDLRTMSSLLLKRVHAPTAHEAKGFHHACPAKPPTGAECERCPRAS